MWKAPLPVTILDCFVRNPNYNPCLIKQRKLCETFMFREN